MKRIAPTGFNPQSARRSSVYREESARSRRVRTDHHCGAIGT